jgi:nucleotidyltransferase/DNA polymerase involved in DNA repair
MSQPARAILHLDMDAFFAAVEQLDHPEYRGKPVVVGADPRGGQGRGVVAACSYEARPYGIRSALPISRAYRLCPTAVFVRPRMSRYAEASAAVFAILRQTTDLVEPLSIDEAFLDVTGSQRALGSAEAIGRALKARIRSELGLPASVGIAPNKFLAKIACDLGKPDGLVVVPAGGERAFLDPLPIGRLWGVGPKTEARLRGMGYQTVGQLARAAPETLEAFFGKSGREVWELANGKDDRDVVPEQAAKSVGAEHTFEQDTADLDLMRRTLLALCDRVGGRLRREGVLAEGVTLKFRDHRFRTLTRAATLDQASDVGDDLFKLAWNLLQHVQWKGSRIRLLGVTATRLLNAGAEREQLSLFHHRADRARRLAQTVDAIHQRFGQEAITRASLSTEKARRRGGEGARGGQGEERAEAKGRRGAEAKRRRGGEP